MVFINDHSDFNGVTSYFRYKKISNRLTKNKNMLIVDREVVEDECYVGQELVFGQLQRFKGL